MSADVDDPLSELPDMFFEASPVLSIQSDHRLGRHPDTYDVSRSFAASLL
jgi:hypothetical protein